MAFRESPKYSLDLVEDFVDSTISAQEFFGDNAQHDVHTRRLLYALFKEFRAGRGGVPAQYLSTITGVPQTSVVRKLRRLEEKFCCVHRKKAGRYYLYYMSRPADPTRDDSFLSFMAKIIDQFEPFVRNHHKQLLAKNGDQD